MLCLKMQSFRGWACLEENVWVPYDLLILLKAAVMVHLMKVAGLLKGIFFGHISKWPKHTLSHCYGHVKVQLFVVLCVAVEDWDKLL